MVRNTLFTNHILSYMLLNIYACVCLCRGVGRNFSRGGGVVLNVNF